MTAPGPVRPMLHCKMCGHRWRTLRASFTPKGCSYCGSPFWQTGKVARLEQAKAQNAPETPEPPTPAPDPFQPLRDQVKEEYAAFLARRALQDERARAEHRERRGQRRYEPHEIDSAGVVPPPLKDGTPFTLGKMTLTRRSRRKAGSK